MFRQCLLILLTTCLTSFVSSGASAQANNNPDVERAEKLSDVNAEWRRQRDELSAEKTLKWREAQDEWRRKLQEINDEDIPAAEKTKKRAAISEEKDATLDAYMKTYNQKLAQTNETRDQNRAMAIAAQGEMLVDFAIDEGAPDAAEDSAQNTASVPPTSTPQTVSGSTTPGTGGHAGAPPIDLSQSLPPTASLGDQILRNNISVDEMRRREQLFAAVQEQRRRADAAGSSGDADGFLGQNDPPHMPMDCDDQNRHVSPGATEICNYIDDNCDFDVDLDPTTGEPLFQMRFLDRDGDLHGDPNTETGVCPQTTRDTESGGYMVIHGNDCDDFDPSRWDNCDDQ